MRIRHCSPKISTAYDNVPQQEIPCSGRRERRLCESSLPPQCATLVVGAEPSAAEFSITRGTETPREASDSELIRCTSSWMEKLTAP